jgi:hypothetical protein
MDLVHPTATDLRAPWSTWPHTSVTQKQSGALTSEELVDSEVSSDGAGTIVLLVVSRVRWGRLLNLYRSLARAAMLMVDDGGVRWHTGHLWPWHARMSSDSA